MSEYLREEWESHRDRIYELYMDLPLEGPGGVMATLAKEGFTPTLQQYQYRFRIWGLRKTRRAHDRGPFSDPPNVRQGEISGHGTPLYDTLEQSDDACLDIDMIDWPSSNLTPHHTSYHYSSIGDHIVALDPMDYDDPSHNDDGPLDADADSSDTGGPYNADESYITTLCDAGMMGWYSEPDWIGADFPPYNTNNQPLSIPSSPERDHIVAVSHRPIYPLNRQEGWCIPREKLFLAPLPSFELAALILKGIYGSHPTSGFLTYYSNPSLLFKNLMEESSSHLTRLTPPAIPYGLDSLDAFAGEGWGPFHGLEARFDGRLIMSITNSFAGLQDLPAAGILKFLNRHHAHEQIVVDIFSIPPCPITKAFAENAFRAYIEADNAHAVRCLLDHGLVDKNKAVCHEHGERFTPLEYAAVRHSLNVLELLIHRNPDVNKSFRRIIHNYDAFELLIRHIGNRQSTLDDRVMSLVDQFLKANTTVLTETISMVLRGFVDSRLAIRLIENTASRAPQALMLSERVLVDIVKNFGNEDATKTVKQILDKCRELGKMKYLLPPLTSVDDALHAIIELEHSYDELVGILLRYSSSSMQILQTAIKAGKRDIAKVILRENLSLAVNLGFDSETGNIETFISDLIISQNESEMPKLSNHDEDWELVRSILYSDPDLIRSILDYDPDFPPYDSWSQDFYSKKFGLPKAMSAALAHGRDKIAWRLLDVGVSVPSHFSHKKREDNLTSLLYVAVKEKKPEFVKAILEFGWDYSRHLRQYTAALELALRSGQDLMFNDIWDACPSYTYIRPETSLYKLALEKCREEWFFDLVKSANKDYKDGALIAAVECERESVFDKLISLGARADDGCALEKAFNDHPHMVEPLLKRFWKAYPQGRAEYGAKLVSNALLRYSESPEILHRCFALNLVAMNMTTRVGEYSDGIFYDTIERCNYDVVKKFIEAAGDVNDTVYSERDGSKITPLLMAIKIRSLEKVRLLIDSGANVNEPGWFGLRRTPLQKAAELDDIPMCQLLLEKNADVNAAPAIFFGATALQFAAINGNCEMATILIEHGARQDIEPSRGRDGRWPLEGAAENGRFDMIDLLWRAHPGPFDTAQCRRAMELAEYEGHFGCKEKIQELMMRHSNPGHQIQ